MKNIGGQEKFNQVFITSESAERLGKNCATNSLISPLERSETERKGPRAPEAKLGKRNSGRKDCHRRQHLDACRRDEKRNSNY